MIQRQRGFTLIELLIVIAIIGIIAAILIPNLLDAMQKAKQKRSVADIKIVGTAMMSWLTDESGAAAAAGASGMVNLTDYSLVTLDQIRAELIPRYIQEVPEKDGWKNTYDYYLDTADPLGAAAIAMRCRGRDGAQDGSTEYTVGGFNPTDYSQDIVWTDGSFVRWPEKL